MEKSLESRLRALFIEHRFEDIIKLTEAVTLSGPDDFRARYCCAIAYFSNGDYNRGLRRLWGMLSVFKSLSGHKEFDKETRLFVGYSALQLSLFANFYGSESSRRDLIFRYSYTAAKIAEIIGQEFGEQPLEKEAGKILKRHYPCRRKVNGNFEEVGSFFIPESPFLLQVEPTNYCNVNCRMCPHSQMKRKRGFMESSLFEKILSGWSNKVMEISLPHLVHEKTVIKYWRPGTIKLFFMGEPLLHPELGRLVRLARNAKVNIGVQTNGMLLREDKIRKELLEARPSTISLSLDGINKDVYEKIRKGARWSVIQEGLAKLHAEREELGLSDEIKISVTSIINSNTEEGRLAAGNFLAPLNPFVDKIFFIVLNRDYRGEFFDARGDIVSYEDNPNPPGSLVEPVCLEPLDKLNILWDGAITACCHDIEGRLKLGHVNQGVDRVWQGDKTGALHQALLKQDLDNFPFCLACRGIRQNEKFYKTKKEVGNEIFS